MWCKNGIVVTEIKCEPGMLFDIEAFYCVDESEYSCPTMRTVPKGDPNTSDVPPDAKPAFSESPMSHPIKASHEGPPEGTNVRAVTDCEAGDLGSWVSPDCPTLDGTASWPDYLAGVRGALEGAMEQAESGSDTAIFTSGGTIATAVSWVLGVPHDRIYGFYEPVFNCSITRLIFSRGRVSLSNFNDTAHLQLLSQQLGETLVTYR